MVIRFLRLSLFAGFALLAAGPALAQAKAWPAHLELLGGYNATKELDGAVVFGTRLGGMIPEFDEGLEEVLLSHLTTSLMENPYGVDEELNLPLRGGFNYL